MVTPAARREAVAHLQALLDVSERRACRVIAMDRTVIRYQLRRDVTVLCASWRMSLFYTSTLWPGSTMSPWSPKVTLNSDTLASRRNLLLLDEEFC